MSTPRKFQRLDPVARREQILDAANSLFAERGYDAVTIEDVAKAAGVARGLVHHYFGGRKEVYLALLERLAAGREDGLRPALGRSARARVADSVSRWMDWTEANRTIYLGTIAPGEDIADPDVRRVVALLLHRAVARSRPSMPISLRIPRACATPWSAGPASIGSRRAAGYATRRLASRRTRCLPRLLNTSFGHSAHVRAGQPNSSRRGAHALGFVRHARVLVRH